MNLRIWTPRPLSTILYEFSRYVIASVFLIDARTADADATPPVADTLGQRMAQS